jgi:hypothetical protein
VVRGLQLVEVPPFISSGLSPTDRRRLSPKAPLDTGATGTAPFSPALTVSCALPSRDTENRDAECHLGMFSADDGRMVCGSPGTMAGSVKGIGSLVRLDSFPLEPKTA